METTGAAHHVLFEETPFNFLASLINGNVFELSL